MAPVSLTPRRPEDIELAVFAHRITVAIDQEAAAVALREQVEAEAIGSGFPVPVWRRALSMMRADPDAMEALERHTAVVLHAVRAGVQTEVTSILVTSDQSQDDRLRRIMDEGYHEAVVGRPCSAGGYTNARDQAAFAEGWHAFHLDLAASDARRAVASIGGALLIEGDGERLSATTSEAA